MKDQPLLSEELTQIHAYWRAANYLSVGQIYLLDNPLLKEPLTLKHIKPRLLGHWGTTPGLNFIYVHMNRMITKNDLNMLFIAGPGHGGPAVVANTYLEGTYSEIYPDISQDEKGLQKLFKQFSFPGGIPSHTAPETPGSIHEGGELGYALSHAYGAVFDNPDLIACCVVGDGEAETGPLATAWHSNKFLDPKRDGVVLPILHLNGYKIANPTVLARISHDELEKLFLGYGYEPYFVEGDEPMAMHQKMAETMDDIISKIKTIWHKARSEGNTERPRWPMIILRSPKGWSGPKEVDGLKTEGSWRSHQVPLSELDKKPEHISILENWMKSYKPEELFDAKGKLIPILASLAPKGTKRMGANPHTNGGALLQPLHLPDFKTYAVDVSHHGQSIAESTRVLGGFLRDVMRYNMHNFRVFGPDETASNRLGALFEVTNRVWMAEQYDTDDHLSQDGRVMEILSEHTCQGWLEGYLLTGRHGFFSCYEAFIHIIDSMFNQHAKWLKVTSREIPWRKPIASLNYLLTSHVWRQDHNGFSHQDPGFIDVVVNKKAHIVNVYFPPDANTLLWVGSQCLKSLNAINVIVAGKQPELQWLGMEEAMSHCEQGIGIWKWASNDADNVPDVVMTCCGDVPTLESLAAVSILNDFVPELKIRFINVVDLMTLEPHEEHQHGLSHEAFNCLFPKDTPVIFAYHGYPWLIHRLAYRRANHEHLHVRGYKEEGTTTTPFDMVVLNDMDRFHLVMDVMDRVPKMKPFAETIKAKMRAKLKEHQTYIETYGQDMPEILNWKWMRER
ncbi:phosphoketolase family protein [Sulfurospirillum diekertiae]|uniref:Probable phosphoketolase n=1 Tax=Sulfurospirillum diekertiae TaxID=1854492 RepID=A0A1Y0HHI8_9BACT|nr:phosphoketolase family protein [Sulfurospirillum diekertiae]ARU47577.1 Xylulose-5-phosphate/fructose-6-phosphate phosphoketolase [Sulfurospirillum diekertiae]ASC92425.1 Xylulose-5-phosphate/fructose-6-phosphate phosphoketolase [Sulfurospirillum diekertiae]